MENKTDVNLILVNGRFHWAETVCRSPKQPTSHLSLAALCTVEYGLLPILTPAASATRYQLGAS